MIMPFGKHEGKDLEDIPSKYLYWLAENCDDDVIAVKADEEWSWREKWDKHVDD